MPKKRIDRICSPLLVEMLVYVYLRSVLGSKNLSHARRSGENDLVTIATPERQIKITNLLLQPHAQRITEYLLYKKTVNYGS